MATDNQNVRPMSFPARIRRVRCLLTRVTRRRLVQWWLNFGISNFLFFHFIFLSGIYAGSVFITKSSTILSCLSISDSLSTSMATSSTTSRLGKRCPPNHVPLPSSMRRSLFPFIFISLDNPTLVLHFACKFLFNFLIIRQIFHFCLYCIIYTRSHLIMLYHMPFQYLCVLCIVSSFLF